MRTPAAMRNALILKSKIEMEMEMRMGFRSGVGFRGSQHTGIRASNRNRMEQAERKMLTKTNLIVCGKRWHRGADSDSLGIGLECVLNGLESEDAVKIVVST